jgi:phage/plasmid primase-like uncharacterized protein
MNDELILAELSRTYEIDIPYLKCDDNWHSFDDPSYKRPKNGKGSYIVKTQSNGELVFVGHSHWPSSTLPVQGTGSIVIRSWDLKKDEVDQDYTQQCDDEWAQWMQRREREAQLREEKIKSVSLKARYDLEKFRPVTDTTPYLTGKEIPPLGDVRQGYDWDGTPFLAIPAYKYSGKGKPKKPAKKKLVGYQRIYDNSDKKNQRDFSPNGGGFFQLGEVPPSPEGVEINLAESYSTSVSVRLGLEEKQPVFCAFNAGNLPALAKELRRQYPDYKIVGRADSDEWPNANGVASHTGYKKMREAMNAIGGTFTMPNFDDLVCAGVTGKDCKPTDYNDLQVYAGMDELKRQLKEGRHIPQKVEPLKFYPSVKAAGNELSKEIGGFLGEFTEVPTVEINARRNAHVTQLISSQVSTSSLRKNDSYIDDVAKIAEDAAKKGDQVMIIGPQEFTGNENKDIQAHEKLLPVIEQFGSQIQLGHFNATRGSNKYKDCDTGIVFSRNQPPTYAIENFARAFFGLDKEEIKLY